jgi:hypothetical protein
MSITISGMINPPPVALPPFLASGSFLAGNISLVQAHTSLDKAPTFKIWVLKHNAVIKSLWVTIEEADHNLTITRAAKHMVVGNHEVARHERRPRRDSISAANKIDVKHT